MVILIALCAFAATLAGGSLAIRWSDRLHLVLGFSAGAVVGVALFDLLPEAMNLAQGHYTPSTISLFIAGGFLAYLLLDRLALLHHHGPDDDEAHGEAHAHAQHGRGTMGALTLSAHSFFDGAAIGFGFQASPSVGLIVTAAVITHDFSDGINTVSFILKGGGAKPRAFKWLLLDAAAPVVGAASTLLVHIPSTAMGPLLAVFAGCFLYLGACDLIPESQHRHPRAATTLMTLAGAGALYVAVHLWSG